MNIFKFAVLNDINGRDLKAILNLHVINNAMRQS